MSAQVELWRVSTVEGTFETDLETLKQWIAEGCVLPTDKVSKGNLNWIDAGRAPMLRAAFNGEPVVTPPKLASAPPIQPVSQVDRPMDHAEPFHSPDEAPPPSTQVANTAAPSNVCYNHPEEPTRYL